MTGFEKSETITFSVACFSIAAVVIAIIASIYFGIMHSNQLYYATMQQCIEAHGTWIPNHGSGSGACVINNQFQ